MLHHGTHGLDGAGRAHGAIPAQILVGELNAGNLLLGRRNGAIQGLGADVAVGEKALREQIDRVESQAISTAERIHDQYQRQYGEHFDLNPTLKEPPKLGARGAANNAVDTKNKFLQ